MEQEVYWVEYRGDIIFVMGMYPSELCTLGVATVVVVLCRENCTMLQQ